MGQNEQSVTCLEHGAENPYEPPSSQIRHLSIEQKSWWRVGWFLLLTPPVAVAVLFLALRFWMLVLATNDPVPNQGAMLIAFLSLLAAIAIGALSMLVGTVILARVRK